MTDVDPIAQRRAEHRHGLERRVTRALTLALPPSIARAIVRDAARSDDIDDKPELCRRVVPSATWQHRLGRLSIWFNDHPAHDSPAPPLGPASGTPSAESVALALYLGVPLDRDELADVLGTSPPNATRKLYRARCALLGASRPCRNPPAELLGAYADSALDIEERFHLREHLHTCGQCRELVERFEALDAALVRILDAPLPDDDEPAAPRRVGIPDTGQWGAAMSVGVIVVLCVTVVGLLLGVDRVLGETTEPVPLVPPPEDRGLDGWLLSSTVDGLAAINLATGERRRLLQTSLTSARPPSIMVSPSGEKVALWRFQEFQRIESSIEIATLTGEPLQTWRWDISTSPGRVSGWLNDDELLFVRAPGQTQGETSEEYLDRQTRENQIQVLNVHTREQRTIFTGSVVWAVPSPDRRYIAIIGVYNHFGEDAPGRTLEIRPVLDGRLGEPVFSEQDRYPLEASRLIWSDDSSALYFTRISDESMHVDADSSSALQVDIAAARVDGGLKLVVEDLGGDRTRLLGVSPDQDTVLYLRRDSARGPDTWDLWRATLDDGVVEPIMTSVAFPFYFTSTATWLADGETAIVNDSQAHYLNEETSSNAVEAASTRFLVIDPTGSVETVVTELGLWGIDAWGEPTLEWIPEERLAAAPARADPATSGSFSEPARVAEAGGDRHTTELSASSPDGAFSLFHQTPIDAPIVWTNGARSSRLLAGSPAPTDVSWAAGSQALVGVQEEDAGTRLTLYASRSRSVADFYDYRSADPAGIEQDTDRAYRRPQFSEDGNQISYFVVDANGGTVELWLSSEALGHTEVLSWTVPEGALVEPPIVSVWTSNHTLVVAVPDGWRDGYPTEARIVEVATQAGGEQPVTVRDLHTFSARGRARGVTLESIEIDPNDEWVAFRQRAYTSSEPEEGVRDSIRIAPAADITQSVDIARGGAGSGIAWSPGGAWISFALDGRLAVARHDGRDLAHLSDPDTNSRYPLWLSDGNLYYTEGSEGSPQLMQIRTR